MRRNGWKILVVATAVVLVPGLARAQGFGIGPRMSFVNADLLSSTPASSSWGGTMRFTSSRHVTIELALDYRSQLGDGGSLRTRDMPFQGSLLLYPVRGTIAPYLLAGYGVYSEDVDQLNNAGQTLSTTSSRRTGLHLGLGAELKIGRHAGLYADYRFRFVQFGSPSGTSESIDIPIPGLSNRLSHQGSMWTSGMAFYF